MQASRCWSARCQAEGLCSTAHYKCLRRLLQVHSTFALSLQPVACVCVIHILTPMSAACVGQMLGDSFQSRVVQKLQRGFHCNTVVCGMVVCSRLDGQGEEGEAVGRRTAASCQAVPKLRMGCGWHSCFGDCKSRLCQLHTFTRRLLLLLLLYVGNRNLWSYLWLPPAHEASLHRWELMRTVTRPMCLLQRPSRCAHRCTRHCVINASKEPVC